MIIGKNVCVGDKNKVIEHNEKQNNINLNISLGSTIKLISLLIVLFLVWMGIINYDQFVTFIFKYIQ